MISGYHVPDLIDKLVWRLCNAQINLASYQLHHSSCARNMPKINVAT